MADSESKQTAEKTSRTNAGEAAKSESGTGQKARRRDTMTIKYVRHRSGKGWIEVGERNEAEWDELLKTAGGCRGVTSVNYRAARADQKEQDDKDPTGQGRRQP